MTYLIFALIFALILAMAIYGYFHLQHIHQLIAELKSSHARLHNIMLQWQAKTPQDRTESQNP